MDGIKKRAGKKITIIDYLKDDNLQKAAETASEADIAIVFTKSNSGEEFSIVEGHKGDRNHLELWNDGDQLVRV